MMKENYNERYNGATGSPLNEPDNWKNLKMEKQNKISSNPRVRGSFHKRTFMEVFCKKCGERYNTNAEYEAVFNDKAEAIECMEDSGWLVKGNDAFCENCH